MTTPGPSLAPGPDRPAPAAPDRGTDATGAATDRTARSQSRLALITALVALVSAIAGPLVSLKINSDQIANQRVIAQAAAEMEQDNYLRTTRRTAYADFATAYSSAALNMLQTSGRLRTAGTSPSELDAALASSNDDLSTVTSAYYALTLVGSAQAVTTASDVLSATASLYEALIAQADSYRDDALPTAEYAALVDAVDDGYQQCTRLQLAFVNSARSDVDADVTHPR
jgi:hypothetical protein